MARLTRPLDHFTLLGFEEADGELENAHCTGRILDGKPRHIIAKLYVRLFKRKKQDFTPGDFELRKKALPMMKRAFEEGDKVRFTKSKLLIDGMAVPVQ